VDVGSGGKLWFRIRSSGPLVQTWITPPNQPGTRIMPETIAGYGGTYTFIDFNPQNWEPGPFLLPTDDPGYQYIYEFQSQWQSGQYNVHLVSLPISSDVAVITELITDSPVAVTLIAVTPEVPQGGTAVLTAAVFNGATPVPDANVALTIIDPSGDVVVPTPLRLFDEGELPKGDHLPDDGLYSNIFTPAEVGEYTIHARITGYRSGATPIYFERDAGASIRVTAPCAALKGSGFLADYGQDDNGNGLYEWLVIEAEATAATGGEWILQAALETSTGKTLSAYGAGPQGTQLLKARIPSSAIHAAGDPGPYRVISVSLACVGEDGAIPSTHLLVDTNTHAYQLSQFEPPPPPDCNGNGIGDPLEIELGSASDCDHDGILDDCGDPVPPALQADSAAAKSRTLSFTVMPPAAGASSLTALQVRMIDLQNPVPPNNNPAGPCCPPGNFTTFDTNANSVCTGTPCAVFPPDTPSGCSESAGYRCTSDADCPNGSCAPAVGCAAVGEGNGCARWVAPPFGYLESNDNPGIGNYRAARLQCEPSCYAWHTEAAVHVTGAEIVPSSTYEVVVVPCVDDVPDETAASCALTMTTRRAGDIATPFQGDPPLTQPNAVDVANAVHKFRNLAGSPPKVIAQIQPNAPEPNSDFNAIDIVTVVDNVRGFGYTYSGPCVCPSTVPCNAKACLGAGQCTGDYGAGATCVKTCDSGPRAGQPCNNDLNCGSCIGGPATGNGAAGIPCDANSDCASGKSGLDAGPRFQYN
jgi:hypothetical protein